MVRRGVRLSAMQATLVSLLSLLSQNETVIFHSLKPSIILIKDVFENIIPRSPCFSTVLTMRLSRLVIMLILIYGHLFVSLGYNIIACVAWRFWLGALSNKGGREQRNREEIGAEATWKTACTDGGLFWVGPHASVRIVPIGSKCSPVNQTFW